MEVNDERDKRVMGFIVQTAGRLSSRHLPLFVIIQILNLRKRAWVGKLTTYLTTYGRGREKQGIVRETRLIGC